MDKKEPSQQSEDYQRHARQHLQLMKRRSVSLFSLFTSAWCENQEVVCVGPLSEAFLFPHHFPTWKDLVHRHRYLSLSPAYCLSALSGPLARKRPTHNDTLAAAGFAATGFDGDPRGSEPPNGSGSWMSAQSSNLIGAGRGNHEEIKRWLLSLQLQCAD